MIGIINQGIKRNGETQYAVQINRKLITFFWHNRDKGLPECLEKAAKAVREHEHQNEEMVKIIFGIDDE